MELFNCQSIANQIRSRPALRTQFALASETEAIVGGFSVESPRTTETFHYVFRQILATGIVTLYVYDETFAEVLTLALGECAPVETITYGIVNVSELFISSPQFRFSLYGLIGGGVGPAQKVGSIYTGATAVDIPAGLCAAFGNRIVLATGNVLLFSDPQAPRTFVALNQIGVAGTITSLVTGTDGLYVATTQGVYVMPIDALAQGQDVSAVFSTSTAYQSFSWDNIAVSQSSIAALDSTAIVPLGAGLKGTPVQDPEINRRYLTPNLVLQDLRYYRLFGGVEGWVMATPDQGFFLLPHKGVGAWVRCAGTTQPKIVGLLADRDGKQLYLASDAVYEFLGDLDDADGNPVTAVATQQLSGGNGPLLRYVYCETDAPEVQITDGGSVITRTYNAGSVGVVGSSLWGVGANYPARTTQTKRGDFSARGPTHTVEICITKANRTMGLGSVSYSGIGSRRPT